MNIIDNKNNLDFDFNIFHTVMDAEKTRKDESNSKEYKIENFHLLNDSNNGPDSNNQKSNCINREYNSNFSNAMSLNTIINDNLIENYFKNKNEKQQHGGLLFNDSSRILPPLTELDTPKSSSISISTLLNNTSSPSLSLTSSEVSLNTSIDSYSLSSIMSKENVNKDIDTSSNQYSCTRTNNINAETSFYNNEGSNQIENSKTCLKVNERFINKSDDIIEKNNFESYYSSQKILNGINYTIEKNSNEKGIKKIILITTVENYLKILLTTMTIIQSKTIYMT
ncbi:hypothetical protein BCR36DRAFT_414605 [Piromyces finnis]|uniref:Uncharacterized protein n=1 Tax=Piromyces finnis TaxID=1754191 RepID=A0A1Y1V1C2_9FUNG|nr:hypothetical protein BCR36DRAFT_414605 [Piromyces finnis]|eukprot:ORX45142.1 hypothetical protein BCR36DRAFT_414605 [Piromyces finnis]